MIDAQNGTFQLQARTGLAQGNSTTATIFTAGAAKEENTSIVEVKVKKGGEGIFEKWQIIRHLSDKRSWATANETNKFSSNSKLADFKNDSFKVSINFTDTLIAIRRMRTKPWSFT